MGFRFSKRIRMAKGINLNLSKSGIGISAGVKGFRIGAGPRGVRATTTIPGTGISFSQQLVPAVPKRRAEFSRREANEASPVLAPPPGTSLSMNKQSTWFGRSAALTLLGFLWAPFWLVAACTYALSWWVNGPASARDFNKGRKLAARGNHQDAAVSLRAAIEKNPANLDARLALAMLLADDLGELAEAYLHSRALVEANPTNEATLAIAATLLCKLNRPGEIVQLLAWFPPSSGRVLIHIAEQMGEALMFGPMVTVLQKSPWLHDAMFGEKLQLLLARAFAAMKSWEPAIEVLKRGPVNAPSRTDYDAAEYRYWLGFCYLQTGDARKAKTYLSKVYAQDVDHRDVSSLLANL